MLVDVDDPMRATMQTLANPCDRRHHPWEAPLRADDVGDPHCRRQTTYPNRHVYRERLREQAFLSRCLSES
jgi:hypothetical protein